MQVLNNGTALEVVNALSVDYSRRIVLSITRESMPIEEISKREHVPISTCYRRIHEMLNYGIVRPDKTIIQPDGKKYVSYKASFTGASISLESGQLKVDVVPNKLNSDKLRDELSAKKESEKPTAETMFSIAHSRVLGDSK